MSTILLTATTSAAQSEDHFSMPAHFTAPGIDGVETATIQKKNHDNSYSDYYVDGILQAITATNTGVVAYAPGIYRVDKDDTAGATSIEVSTTEIP